MAGTAAADEVLADRSVRHKHQLRRQEKPPMDSISMISTSGSASPEQIKAIARQFDPQHFHLDNEAVFSGLAASGWHTAAATMRLLDEGGLPFASGIVGAGGELNWPNPARPGDTLQVESEVLDIRLS
jgi:acyl dehydratase